jgi:hypothetical protein
MNFLPRDRVRVTSISGGTGAFELDQAVTGFQDFSSVAPAGKAWNVKYLTLHKVLDVEAEEATPTGVFFRDDGLKMYVVGSSGDDVNEYSLSSAWDVSTAANVRSFSVASQDTSPQDIFFRPDGTKMYIVGGTGFDVNEYNLSTAWSVSTATFVQNFSVSTQEATPTGVFFRDDGLKMYIVGSSGDEVNEYNLSTAWNISTATFVQNFSVSTQTTGPTGVFFKNDGTKMFVVDSFDLFEYNLSSAWNISTATFVQSFEFPLVRGGSRSISGLFIRNDGTKLYSIYGSPDYLVEFHFGITNTYYCITNGRDWEVGIGIVSSGGTYLERATVLSSSNSGALVNWGGGTKDVFVTQSAENVQGSAPTADNSSIDTNLFAWENFQKKLQLSVNSGTTFTQNQITVTMNDVYATAGAYAGGVLAPNGDIHFIPFFADRGQKVNYRTKSVSTYALVYTAGTYWGGVLAPNGDIHFVPSGANRGQKISAAGVVSTYSLVYTTSAGAYRGGVLAPNGDIHFVPHRGSVGQKVSAAGVVSTYSLLYTLSGGAYIGGVLAPNGDIHFVPHGGLRGQKISASGVVSTYTIIESGSQSYSGGVLSPNGDIHFVPYDAVVGQKVNGITGVVSTYALVRTGGNAYSGGVLAPNGDIHFVPYTIEIDADAIGQKVSITGIVSTYSLIFRPDSLQTNDIYNGGVLAPDGDIYLVKHDTRAEIQRIATNSAIPFDIDTCLSPFLNKF